MIHSFLIIWIRAVFKLVIAQNLSRFYLLQTFFREHLIQFDPPYMVKQHCKLKMDMTEPISYTVRETSGKKIGSYS